MSSVLSSQSRPNLHKQFKSKKLALYNGANFFLLLMLFLATSCGRKQKNVFVFSDKESVKINKLMLPAIKGINACKTNHGNIISWRPSAIPDSLQQYQTTLMGYSIYRLVCTHIVPRKPINKTTVQETIFFDKRKHQKTPLFYLVRAVFKINDQIIEGPTSQIVQAL